jgi:hypothetical protein
LLGDEKMHYRKQATAQTFVFLYWNHKKEAKIAQVL